MPYDFALGDKIGCGEPYTFYIGTGDFSAGCWFRPRFVTGDAGRYPEMFGKEAISGDGWSFKTYQGFVAFECGALSITGATALVVDQLYFACMTRRGSTVTGYLNGISDGTGSDSSDVGISGTPVMMGIRTTESGARFDGTIRNCFFLPYGLAAAQVFDTFKRDNPEHLRGVRGHHWPLETNTYDHWGHVLGVATGAKSVRDLRIKTRRIIGLDLGTSPPPPPPWFPPMSLSNPPLARPEMIPY